MSSPIFPPTSAQDILAFQLSSWYLTFSRITIKSTIIRPLDDAFVRYLHADGVMVPKGSDAQEQAQVNGNGHANGHTESVLDSDSEDEDEEEGETYAFPDLDAQIRAAIASYGAVFPKLNFSAPKDASWILPSSTPLKCTSPMDVYLLLKSSDFVSHDLDPERVFEGCTIGHSASEIIGEEEREATESERPKYELELTLRKWYHVDPSREFRCFVRERKLIGITQRDTNFYDYLNSLETQEKISRTITEFWAREIKDKWKTDHYTFDLIVTRSLESAYIVDFNPFLSRTDPLLFTYEDLWDHFDSQQRPNPTTPNLSSSNTSSTSPQPIAPLLRVIDSRSHPSATRSSPANVHNMVPFDMLSLGEGRTVNDFESVWSQHVRRANEESDDSSEDE